jgi:hypothetical protein
MPQRRSTRPTVAPTATSTGAAPTLWPEGQQALIRMYGQGFGDCFLLALPRQRATDAAAADEERPVYVVIDCGVMMNTPGETDRMKTIVKDLRETTGGRIDLLVITHEHWDHLSSFLQAEEEWKQIMIDALWMAWTETPDPDGLPGYIKDLLKKHRKALVRVADQAQRFGLTDRQSTTLGLMSFLFEAPGDGRSFGVARDVGQAFDAAKALVPEERRLCCDPGDVYRLPGTEAVCYVLGPPKDQDRLTRTDQPKETYAAKERADGQGAMKLDPTLAFQRIVEGRSPFNAIAMPLLGPDLLAEAAGGSERAGLLTELDVYERSFPFDRSVRVPLADAEAAVADFPAAYPALTSYCDDVNAWRRVDFDWLSAAETFALRLNDLTNNTSLVLAIELPAAADGDGDKGKVLFFVGDAQVGNWLSWDDLQSWQPKGDVAITRTKPDIGDLLKRSVFYKVGHHGSHNATLKAKGVERMRDDKALTAFVPVSAPVACDIQGWCKIPLETILQALSDRTGGRVVLANGNVWPPVDDTNQLARERARIGLQVSREKLPEKVYQGKRIEGEVPLWVQIAIDY